jgi:hypothetical protein
MGFIILGVFFDAANVSCRSMYVSMHADVNT